jgi:hypothetical protein
MNLQKTCVDGKGIVVSGVFPRIARLRSEYHEYINDVDRVLVALKNLRVRADIFTFLQPINDRVPRFDYATGSDEIAVLQITDYDTWWRKQVNDKTRNMCRKAGKKGVEIKVVEFSNELARGIHKIYNECPIVQGRPSKHYGKDFETLKKAHETFLDQSLFIGAYFGGQLIGFIKLILHPGGKSASLMQIMSLVAHRDKAPTNALLAKAVELCAERGVEYLQYGIWSRRSLGDFKKHHGFSRVEIPRYFVPLTLRGRVAVAIGLHRTFKRFVPVGFQDMLANLRGKWYLFKFRSQLQSQGL